MSLFKFLPLVQEMAALVPEPSTTFNCPGGLQVRKKQKPEPFSSIFKNHEEKLPLDFTFISDERGVHGK